MSSHTTPNAEQVRYWNEDAGPRWVELRDQLDAQLRDIGLAAMDAVAIEPGQRALDVGAGCGDTTLDLARRVGALGRVHALDVSAVMLARAKERAATERLGNVTFQVADAQSAEVEGAPYDVVYSRFGIMFFDAPTQAFARLLAATRPGGRFAACCWRGREENPWLAAPMAAAAPHLELPAPAAADAPGPYALADGARTSRILREAGWAEVTLTPLDVSLRLGGRGNVDAAVDLITRLGPVGLAMDRAPAETRDRVLRAVRAVLAPHAGPDGVRMPAAAWIVTARRP